MKLPLASLLAAMGILPMAWISAAAWQTPSASTPSAPQTTPAPQQGVPSIPSLPSVNTQPFNNAQTPNTQPLNTQAPNLSLPNSTTPSSPAATTFGTAAPQDAYAAPNSRAAGAAPIQSFDPNSTARFPSHPNSTPGPRATTINPSRVPASNYGSAPSPPDPSSAGFPKAIEYAKRCRFKSLS